MTTSIEAVRVNGPLVEYAGGFAEALRQQGYSELSAASQLRVLAHLSRWMVETGHQPGELTRTLVSEFLRKRRGEGYTHWRSERGLAPLLGYLRGLGVLPEEVEARPEGPLEELLRGYQEHLVRERGLVGTTVTGYQKVARRFLVERSREGGLDLEGLSGEEVARFVLGESRSLSVGMAKYMVTGLRSLLRFLYLEGLAGPLSAAVPAVAGWRGGHLPRALTPEQVASLLDSCARSTVVGRRDYAMLTMLARLGLRAHEVAVLELEDFDWGRGEVVIRGKGTRLERLPLPVDVGEAVSTYILGGRPKGLCRRLFLRVRAPYGGIQSRAVQGAVSEACRRTGMASVGAHSLRHTVATEMLRAGASLPDVGQVLRHRSLSTTAIYAKVDRTRLRELAQQWPGGAV
jgi:site-specific recombinase XerD